MARKSKKNNRRKAVRNNGSEPENGSRFQGHDLFNVLVIALLVVLFFLPVVLAGKVFFTGDVMNVYNPYQAINAEQLAKGQMPLWTDRFFCGFPLFAESQGAVFYPPTRLAYYLAPVSHAFTLDALFHFFLAGFFMYVLARYLGQRPLAALFAATAFGFSGLFCTLIMNFTIFRSATWIPIVFYFSRRNLTEAGLKWTFLLALSLVFQMMGGSLQVTGITCLVIGIDAIYVVIASLAKGKFIGTLMRLVKLALGVALAVGLYAFQLLPTMELTALAQRGVEASYETSSSYSYPLQHLLDFLMPGYYGDPGYGTGLPGIPRASDYFGYVGIVGLGLALYALGSKRSGIFWPIAIVFVLLALGPVGMLFDFVYHNVPFFDKFRGPERFLMGYIFAVALLAGFGANKILRKREMEEEEEEEASRGKEDEEEEEEPPRSRGVWGIVLLLLVIVAIIGSLPLMGSAGQAAFDRIMASTLGPIIGVSITADNFGQYEAWRSYAPWVILYFCAFAAAVPLVNMIFGRTSSARGLVILFLIINCIDLALVSGRNHNDRLIDGSFFADDPPTAAFIKEKAPNSRIYSFGRLHYAEELFGHTPVESWYQGSGGSDEDYFKLREILTPNLSAYFGLYDAGGFASLFTEDYYLFEGIVIQQLSNVVAGMNLPSKLPNGRTRHLLLDTMAAEYIVTSYPFPEGERFQKVFDGDVDIYRNKMALPRAYVVHPGKVIDVDYSKPEQLIGLVDLIGSFDFEGSVIVPHGAKVPTDPANPGISFDIIPKVVEPGKVKVGVKIDRPGLFVLADSYYPGWKAKVDGKKAEILKTNFYFRGVVLDTPGEHEVEFVFKPGSFDKGIKVSILSFILFLIIAIGKGLIDKGRPEEPEPSRGQVKVVKHGLFGRRVEYEDEYDEDEDEDY